MVSIAVPFKNINIPSIDKNKFTKGFSDGNEESMQNEINSLTLESVTNL